MHLSQNLSAKELSDEEIIRLLDIDATKAFQEMYNKYWWPLYKFAFVRIKDQDLAENIVQDIFISLWQSIASLQITTTLPAYLFSATQKRVYSTIRKQNLFTKYMDHAAALPEAVLSDPDQIYQAKELNNQINDKITELPPKAREVFLLSRREGLNTQEIAGRLKISPRTVETHLHNSLKFLRLAFKAKFQ